MEHVSRILTGSEMLERTLASLKPNLARGRWGPWLLRRSTLELVFDKPGGYRIDLSQMTTPAQMLDWIYQVRGKSWAGAPEVGFLVDALGDLFDPQATLCTDGQPTRIDAGKHLRNLFAKIDA